MNFPVYLVPGFPADLWSRYVTALIDIWEPTSEFTQAPRRDDAATFQQRSME
jgi:hypothetical protein